MVVFVGLGWVGLSCVFVCFEDFEDKCSCLETISNESSVGAPHLLHWRCWVQFMDPFNSLMDCYGSK